MPDYIAWVYKMSDDKNNEYLNKLKNKLKQKPGIVKLALKVLLPLSSPLEILYFITRYGFLDSISRTYNLGNRFSLPVGSIIANPLYVPTKGGEIARIDSSAGTYSTVRFSPKLRAEANCILGGFRLDQYLDRPREELTQTLPYTPASLEDRLDTDLSAFSKLLDHEFIVQKSLGEAYGMVFPNDRALQNRLSICGLSEKPSYQVTPKGNSLVLLFVSGGDKKPTPQLKLSDKPSPAYA